MRRFTASKLRWCSVLAGTTFGVLLLLSLFTSDPEVYPRTGKWRGIGNHTKSISSNPIDAQILHLPNWVGERSWGLSADAAGAHFPNGISGPSQKTLKGSSVDLEVEIAWTNFFNGTTNGLILELGAMDGKVFSASEFFEKEAGWKAILVEASSQALEIPQNRHNALSLQLAVCQRRSTIHFVNAEDVGGVLEFMTPQFLRELHPKLLKTDQGQGTSVMEMLDWNKVAEADYVVKLPCFPLQSVLDRFQFQHVNFLVLDLEGGELAALQSLDFGRVHFDVLCIETNRFKNGSDPYIEQVVSFVTGKGYKLFHRTKGRNSWFVSPRWKKP